MADYKVTDTELTSIANAIRAKTGKSDQIEFPTEFVSEIGNISGGGSTNILSGTDAPTASVGSDGAIYLQYGLPSEYDALDYIQGTGTQYLTIPYKPNNKTSVRLKANFQSLNEEAIFGANWSPNGFFLMAAINGLKWHEGSSSSVIEVNGSPSMNEDCIIYTSMNGIRINETNYPLVSNYDPEGYGISVFWTTRNTTGYSRPKKGIYKLYWFEIYDNEALCHLLKPAKRKSDDAVGMYDVLSGVFYANEGTGVFQYGSVVTDKNVYGTHLKNNNVWQSLIDSSIDDVNKGSSAADDPI